MRDGLEASIRAKAIAHEMRLYVYARQCKKGLPGWRDQMRL